MAGPAFPIEDAAILGWNLIVAAPAFAKFKAYVHGRLDDAGVPKDPESPHKAEGCRIGGRLDVVLEANAALLAACRAALPAIAWGATHSDGNASHFADVINQLNAAVDKAEAK